MEGPHEGSESMHAYQSCRIIVHVGSDQCCLAVDEESSAQLPTMSTSITCQRGAERNIRMFQMRAHIACLVLVHVRVDQPRFSSRSDVDGTTLRKENDRALVPADELKYRRFKCKRPLHISVPA